MYFPIDYKHAISSKVIRINHTRLIETVEISMPLLSKLIGLTRPV